MGISFEPVKNGVWRALVAGVVVLSLSGLLSMYLRWGAEPRITAVELACAPAGQAAVKLAMSARTPALVEATVVLHDVVVGRSRPTLLLPNRREEVTVEVDPAFVGEGEVRIEEPGPISRLPGSAFSARALRLGTLRCP